jgi:CheY-like chemotaxis protein
MPTNVLIVDDQRELIRNLKAGIEGLKDEFVIQGVLSGEEALLEARFRKIELLVSEVRLPGLSGAELAIRIRRINPALKVVLTSGIASREIKKEIESAAPDAFFAKPFEMAEFLAACENLLGLLGAPGPLPSPQPELFTEEEPAADGKGIADRLASLRQGIQAVTAILLDGNGQIVVRAGELPEAEIETVLIPSLMAAFSTGQKISHFLKQAFPDNLQIFYGSAYDVVFSPVGNTYALLAITNGQALSARVGVVAEKIKSAIADLSGILESLGVTVSFADSVSVPPFLTELDTLVEIPAGEVDADLEALLAVPEAAPVPVDLDLFWDETESEQSGIGSLNADALSYEQALQLGLAPEDE